MRSRNSEAWRSLLRESIEETLNQVVGMHSADWIFLSALDDEHRRRLVHLLPLSLHHIVLHFRHDAGVLRQRFYLGLLGGSKRSGHGVKHPAVIGPRGLI